MRRILILVAVLLAAPMSAHAGDTPPNPFASLFEVLEHFLETAESHVLSWGGDMSSDVGSGEVDEPRALYEATDPRLDPAGPNSDSEDDTMEEEVLLPEFGPWIEPVG